MRVCASDVGGKNCGEGGGFGEGFYLEVPVGFSFVVGKSGGAGKRSGC